LTIRLAASFRHFFGAVVILTSLVSLSNIAWAQTVSVSTPVTGSTVPNPVHIHATYSGTARYMKLWLNGMPSTTQSNTNTFDVTMTLATGAVRIVVQAADSTTGTVASSSPVNITVTAAGGGNTITVSPSSVSLTPSATQQFSATDSGGLPVTWSASCGTITSSGLYTAPSTTGTCTITAADSTGAKGTATATIQSSSSPVTFITPLANAAVASPVHVRFTYSGTASYMKLWVDGVAQPAQHDPQVYDTTITLANGSHKLQGQGHDATLNVTFTTTEFIAVPTGPTVTVSPSSVNLVPGGTQQFAANAPVTWSAIGDGTINATGLFTAGATSGSATVTAAATDGSGATGTANVTVGTAANGNYTTWKNDNMRTGQQLNETQLTPTNVNSTTFGIKFSVSVDAAVYAQPLYMSGLTINGATHNVVFVATENDSVYAFDADNPGPFLWKKNLLNGGVPIPQANVGSTIFGGIGITSTPVIDQNTNTIYVVTEDLENSTNYVFRIHALDVTTGNEKFGGPKVISNTNFQPKEQLQRSALLLANGNVYFTFASQGDHTPWHGWVFAYTAATLSKVAAYNATSTGSAGGIWGGGNAMAADADGNIYVATGNGSWNGTTNLSMSYIKLSPNLSVLDSFTIFNEQTLSNGDRDLGSGGLVLLPDQPGTFPHELVACGKPSPIYVINRDDMGGAQSGVGSNDIQELPNVIGGTSGTQASDHCFMSPAYWNGNLYFIGNNDVIKQFTISSSSGTALLSSTPVAKGIFTFPFPGGQPVVSSNGSSNGIVWAVDHAASTATALHAFDASSVSKTLYTSPALGKGTKWSTPTVINGKVYVAINGKLIVFALK
jgi:hypothetical protein